MYHFARLQWIISICQWLSVCVQNHLKTAVMPAVGRCYSPLPRHGLAMERGMPGMTIPDVKFMYEYDVVKYIVYKCIIPVQIGPGGVGKPHFVATERRPQGALLTSWQNPTFTEEGFLLQNGSPSWPLVTKMRSPIFARLASARIRWLDLPFTEWWGLGVAILALS